MSLVDLSIYKFCRKFCFLSLKISKKNKNKNSPAGRRTLLLFFSTSVPPIKKLKSKFFGTDIKYRKKEELS